MPSAGKNTISPIWSLPFLNLSLVSFERRDPLLQNITSGVRMPLGGIKIGE
ncbi:MAG: hypothetical protein LBE89_07995 [Helicobacteraceae bacterium]|nr:hypothetical protein [Helicobacteraceae bacterium]